MVKLILTSLNLHFSAFIFKRDILPVHMLSLIKIALWIYHHPGIKKIIQESMLKPHHMLLTLKLAQFFLFYFIFSHTGNVSFKKLFTH